MFLNPLIKSSTFKIEQMFLGRIFPYFGPWLLNKLAENVLFCMSDTIRVFRSRVWDHKL